MLREGQPEEGPRRDQRHGVHRQAGQAQGLLHLGLLRIGRHPDTSFLSGQSGRGPGGDRPRPIAGDEPYADRNETRVSPRKQPPWPNRKRSGAVAGLNWFNVLAKSVPLVSGPCPATLAHKIRSVAEASVGWVEGHHAKRGREPHQTREKPMVGLAALDPPYRSATFRWRNHLWQLRGRMAQFVCGALILSIGCPVSGHFVAATGLPMKPPFLPSPPELESSVRVKRSCQQLPREPRHGAGLCRIVLDRAGADQERRQRRLLAAGRRRGAADPRGGGPAGRRRGRPGPRGGGQPPGGGHRLAEVPRGQAGDLAPRQALWQMFTAANLAVYDQGMEHRAPRDAWPPR